MRKTYMTPAVEIHRIQTETLICLSRFGTASGDDALVKRRRKSVDDLDLFDNVEDAIATEEEDDEDF